MPENKNQNVVVSKGVARGHILCCVSVVFICFMLTCLNLYMMSSTRSVLRHLDARLDARPDGLFQQRLKEAASAMDAMQVPIQVPLQAPLQVGEGDDDFILLAPSDLDNAWTTATGRLLVPVGQPEDDDNGWKQMQVQLGEQTSAQQRHIDSLHDKLADQYRAREELQRDQQNLLREHHKLSMEHQKQIAKKDRQLLKEKHRALQQGAQHQDEVRRYQSELETLKQAVEGVMQPSDATTTSAPVKELPTDSNSTTTILEVSIPVEEAAAPEVAVSADTPPVVNPLDHIFSAVFGPSPGTFFFPSSRSTSRDTEEQHRVVNRVLDSDEHARRRRDLSGDRAERRQRRLALLQSRLGDRKRRHDQDDAKGPLMRIDEGQMVPLSSVPAVMDSDSAFSRRRRHQGLLAARHG